jgi:uncharacterized protein (DUF486 family)
MPAISPSLLPILMLFASNVFMTFAWYAAFEVQGTRAAIGDHGELGHRVLRILLAVPANRWGSECIRRRSSRLHTGGRHAGRVRRLSVLYLKEPLGWNHGWASP